MTTLERMELLLIFIFFFIFPMQTSLAAAQPPTPVGRVVWIKGTLKAVMDNKEERILKDKSILYLHDTLITDASSKAEIGFTDQTLMTLRENTTFKIDKYQFNSGKKKAGGKSSMDLIEGGFRTITGAIATNTPDNYEVNTPVATIGVRGTEYQTYTQGDTTYLGYYSGTPCIKLKKECNEREQKSTGKLKHEQGVDKDKNNKNRKGWICLNKNLRWVKVVGPCGKPEPLVERPDVFKNDLEITPAYIEPFTMPGPSSNVERNANSFCIR